MARSVYPIETISLFRAEAKQIVAQPRILTPEIALRGWRSWSTKVSQPSLAQNRMTTPRILSLSTRVAKRQEI